MQEQRWPWLLAAGLMLTSAVAAAWSTTCTGYRAGGACWKAPSSTPLSGDGRTYGVCAKLDPAIKAAMRACEARIDGDIYGQAPWTSELLVLAMAFAGLAWLTLVVALRWQLRTKAVAALPGLATVGLALAVAATIGAERGEDHTLSPEMLSVAGEWSALLALAMIWAWQPEVRTRRRFLRLAVALWGTAAFGVFHLMLEYTIMIGFSERDWDDPPGTGDTTVAAIAISAILLVIMTLRMPRTAADGDPQPD